MSLSTPVDAWLEVIDVTAPMVQSVRDALGMQAVRLVSREAGPEPPEHGLVLFATMTPEVITRIRAITSRRPDRILAVSTKVLGGGDGWDLLHAGASDALTWRDPEESARHVAERFRRWQTIDELLGSQHVQDNLVGESPRWRGVLRNAVEVARFTNASVLLTGESGTGKERVAQLIHELDPRPNKSKLVVLDCSTVVPSLSGSEFFGHEKGAFTGASAAREGAFELANGGTLFLDEVGELTVALQAELLRVIQEGTFKRVGSNVWRKSSFRLICATNRDLTTERANGMFRDDFYYRIAGSTLHLPTLRERADDIIPLFRHFVRHVHPDRALPEIEDGVRDLLVSRTYPGNVRDLRSLALQIAHRHLGDGYITVGDIPEHDRPPPAPTAVADPSDGFARCVGARLAQGATLDDITSAARDAAMRLAIAREAGSLGRAARRLGVTVGALEVWQQAQDANDGQRMAP